MPSISRSSPTRGSCTVVVSVVIWRLSLDRSISRYLYRPPARLRRTSPPPAAAPPLVSPVPERTDRHHPDTSSLRTTKRNRPMSRRHADQASINPTFQDL